MDNYDNTNRWVLFKQDDRPSDRHPEYTGTLNVEGTEYWINAWVKTSKNGVKFFSGSIKEKTARKTVTAPKSQDKPAEAFFDDDIPF
jgi:hypothetical protein